MSTTQLCTTRHPRRPDWVNTTPRVTGRRTVFAVTSGGVGRAVFAPNARAGRATRTHDERQPRCEAPRLLVLHTGRYHTPEAGQAAPEAKAGWWHTRRLLATGPVPRMVPAVRARRLRQPQCGPHGVQAGAGRCVEADLERDGWWDAGVGLARPRVHPPPVAERRGTASATTTVLTVVHGPGRQLVTGGGLSPLPVCSRCHSDRASPQGMRRQRSSSRLGRSNGQGGACGVCANAGGRLNAWSHVISRARAWCVALAVRHRGHISRRPAMCTQPRRWLATRAARLVGHHACRRPAHVTTASAIAVSGIQRVDRAWWCLGRVSRCAAGRMRHAGDASSMCALHPLDIGFRWQARVVRLAGTTGIAATCAVTLGLMQRSCTCVGIAPCDVLPCCRRHAVAGCTGTTGVGGSAQRASTSTVAPNVDAPNAAGLRSRISVPNAGTPLPGPPCVRRDPATINVAAVAGTTVTATAVRVSCRVLLLACVPSPTLHSGAVVAGSR